MQTHSLALRINKWRVPEEREIQNRRRDEELGGGLHGCLPSTVAEDADADDVDGDSG